MLVQTQQLLAVGGSSNNFGQFVDIAGNYAAMYDPQVSGGQVDVYTKSGNSWVLLQSIQAPAPASNDSFGAPVKFSPDASWLFVGEGNKAGTRGTVFAYLLTGGLYVLTQTIQGTDGAVTDHFGVSIATANESLIVGAPQSPSGAVGQPGNVYYYTLVAGTWTLQQKFGQAGTTKFGDVGAVSTGGGWLVVQGLVGGAAEAFLFSLIAGSWTLQQTITPGAGFSYGNTGSGISRYGVFLTPTGVTLVLGGISTGAPFNEFAEVYTLSGGVWTLLQRILHVLDLTGDPEFFASTNAIAGNDSNLLIGADQATYSGGNPGPGAVYVYSLSSGTFTLSQTLLADPAQTPQLFGISVAVLPNLSFAVIGNQKFFGGTPPVTMFGSATSVPASQLVFYGVRRIKNGPKDPSPSFYNYYEKPYNIRVPVTLTQPFDSTLPLYSVFTRYKSLIEDFDFELRRIVKSCKDGNGNELVVPASPFALVLYDGVEVARSNLPVLAEFICDDPVAVEGRNYWPTPPLMYRVNSSLQVDVFPLLGPSITLPVTVELLFVGVRRIPC